ncbi:MAG: DHH family phosphoesterase [Deltaproteobacteria bacterium]|nr:DHH family phosphoesterase [Deltaproteobacteria bacterium]
MRIVVITRSELPLLFFEGSAPEEPRLVLSDDRALVRRAYRRGFHTATGDLDSDRLYRRVRACAADRFLVFLPAGHELDRCLVALLSAAPDAAVTVLLEPGVPPPARWKDHVQFTPTDRVGSTFLRIELERAATRGMLAAIRFLFRGAERVLLLVQDDPDPDGLASALALRSLLGRNRLTAVIGSFGRVTRPENVAMTRLLDIQVQHLAPGALREFDRVALLDVQPYHSPSIPTEVDLVIDHHPRRSNYQATIRDIRPRYGATSTIMTEYVLAAGAPISQRLATALLYGIKSDTQLLGRDATPMDVAAFAALYPDASHPLLRRIDRPQLPRRDLGTLSHAFRNAQIHHDILFTHLGPLSREDVIPYIADFCLEVEGVDWSVVSGVFEGRLTISVRNYGGSRSAGDVVKAAFEPYGSAGGHRSMAKAVIPLGQLPPTCLDHEAWVRDAFLATYAVREEIEAPWEPT